MDVKGTDLRKKTLYAFRRKHAQQKTLQSYVVETTAAVEKYIPTGELPLAVKETRTDRVGNSVGKRRDQLLVMTGKTCGPLGGR